MKDNINKRLPGGIHTAIVTPFRGEGVDLEAFERLLDIQNENGVAGVVVLGTTGESPTVTDRERRALIGLAAKKLGGKKALTVGCGSNDTAAAVENVKLAASLGAGFVLVVAPYYNRPSKRGLLRHFITVADASPVPVVMYNVPSRTGSDIPADVLSVLSAHPNIVAYKEASLDLPSVTAKTAAAPDLDFFCGNDTLLYHFLCLGAAGAISVSSNLKPEKTCAVTELFEKGDTAGAREAFFAIYPYLSALSLDTNPVPIKTVMAAAGLISPKVRLPLCEMTAENKTKLLYEAESAGMIIN